MSLTGCFLGLISIRSAGGGGSGGDAWQAERRVPATQQHIKTRIILHRAL